MLAWPPALARAEEGNAHQRNTVVRSSFPLPCVVPERMVLRITHGFY